MENDNKKTKVFIARESNDKVNENTQEYIPDKGSDALIINNCYKDEYYGDYDEELGNLSYGLEIMHFLVIYIFIFIFYFPIRNLSILKEIQTNWNIII